MKIAIIGYGKMGKAIEEIALKKHHEIVLKISSNNTSELTISNLQTADVAIEFTNALNVLQNLKLCFDANIPVVTGTTGWLQHYSETENYCAKKKGTFLYASNFSIGVNLFFEINKYVATLLNSHKEYNVLLEEIHHTQKKDAPSGTAITLAEQILQRNSSKKKWVNEKNQQPEELEIISKRIDEIAGTHKIKYQSDIDDIEIIHTAHNRKGFAQGAVAAAEFIQNKKGIFTMKDILDANSF